MSGLGLPAVILILASFRVAKLRSCNPTDYEDRVNESVCDTIREQLSIRVLPPLLEQNEVALPPRKNFYYDLACALVPQNGEADLQLLSAMYNNLKSHGVNSQFYTQVIDTVAFFLVWA